MRLLVSILFTFIIMPSAMAQRECGTVTHNRQTFTLPANKPGESGGYNRDTVSNEIITIPVVVHLLYKTGEQNISDDQIRSQVEVLNNDFRRLNADAANTPIVFKSASADSRIMFCLAQVSPGGRPTKGIIRKYTDKDFFLGDDGMKYSAAGGDDAWNSKKYLNIWVCTLFGRSLGYSTLPGGPADKDGVVIKYDVFGSRGFLRAPYTKGRTATHEIGHWLGLRHLWGDTNCGSDDVDDTPSQQGYNFNCPAFPHVSSCSPNGNGDMFMNFMDFSSDACMNMFTNGQKSKMRSLFALNGLRNSFLNSFACDSSLASGGPLPADTTALARPVAGISVYPNPVQSDVNISSINNYELTGKTCTVYNSQGMMVITRQLFSEKEKLSMSHLSAGLYIMMIGEGNDKKTLKIIRQ